MADPGPAPAAPPVGRVSRGCVLFVITEDWFFVSHFLPLARAVQAEGYAVAVHLRINDPGHRATIERCGIRVVPSSFDRGAAGVAGNLRQILRFAALFRREKPDVVHLISLRVVVLAGVAARLARVAVRVHALTGLGLLGVSPGARGRLAVAALAALLRGLRGAGAGFLFENEADPRRLGWRPGEPDLLVVGGAGIDPEVETVLPLPPAPPLKLAVVSRMIHSKGIAVAVAALARARARGADVTLTLVGDADPGNPRALTPDELRAFAAEPGVTWRGRTNDVRAVWRDHHAACVPSLGGEGLPRALLEAAAAGRPVVTTDTPGCASFVRPLREGFVVPPADPEALAAAFVALAADARLVQRLGDAARARVLEGFTVAAVAAGVLGLYRRLAAGKARR